jgi:hypothetical protein
LCFEICDLKNLASIYSSQDNRSERQKNRETLNNINKKQSATFPVAVSVLRKVLTVDGHYTLPSSMDIYLEPNQAPWCKTVTKHNKNSGLQSLLLTMKNCTIYFLLFAVVSGISLFAMKYILWAMFKWGGGGAIGLALIFTFVYIGFFFAVTKNWEGYEQYVSYAGMKWIWALGFMQLAILGVLYHLLPQYFPTIIADFFFA